MTLRIVSIDNHPSIRLAVDGPMTSDSLPAGPTEMLGSLLGGGWASHRILLDLGKADHIDSSAIGWLLNCHKALESGGGAMVLHSVHPNVARVLKMLKIDCILPIADNEQAANDMLGVREKRHAA
jgi:anti-anti-sigma factor